MQDKSDSSVITHIIQQLSQITGVEWCARNMIKVDGKIDHSINPLHITLQTKEKVARPGRVISEMQKFGLLQRSANHTFSAGHIEAGSVVINLADIRRDELQSFYNDVQLNIALQGEDEAIQWLQVYSQPCEPHIRGI